MHLTPPLPFPAPFLNHISKSDTRQFEITHN